MNYKKSRLMRVDDGFAQEMKKLRQECGGMPYTDLTSQMTPKIKKMRINLKFKRVKNNVYLAMILMLSQSIVIFTAINTMVALI